MEIDFFSLPYCLDESVYSRDDQNRLIVWERKKYFIYNLSIQIDGLERVGRCRESSVSVSDWDGLVVDTRLSSEATVETKTLTEGGKKGSVVAQLATKQLPAEGPNFSWSLRRSVAHRHQSSPGRRYELPLRYLRPVCSSASFFDKKKCPFSPLAISLITCLTCYKNFGRPGSICVITFWLLPTKANRVIWSSTLSTSFRRGRRIEKSFSTTSFIENLSVCFVIGRKRRRADHR